MVARVMTQILIDTGPSGPRGWHGREAMLRCPRRAQWERTVGRGTGAGSSDRDALERGSLLHVGLAHWSARHQAVQHGWDPEQYYAPLDAVALVADREGWQQWVPLVQRTVSDFAVGMIGATHPEIIGVEHRVEYDVPAWSGPPKAAGRVYQRTARADLIYRANDGMYWIRDWKSTYRIDSRKRVGFTLSGQLIGMQWYGRQAFGNLFGGLEVTLVEWPKVKSGTPGRVEFMRTPIAPFALQKYPATVQWGEELGPWMTEQFDNDWPLALSEQGPCVDRYGICEWFECCRFGVSETGGARE